MTCQLIQKFDTFFFYIINNKFQNSALDLLMPLITELGSVYLVTAVGLFLLLFKRKDIKATGFLVLSGLAISEALSTILKEIFSRPRPLAVLENIHLLCHRSYINSFPSGHTTLAFSITTIIVLLFPRLKTVLFILASLVGFSRIYIGAHFPTDVIAGAILGMFIGLIISHIWKKSFQTFKEG